MQSVTKVLLLVTLLSTSCGKRVRHHDNRQATQNVYAECYQQAYNANCVIHYSRPEPFPNYRLGYRAFYNQYCFNSYNRCLGAYGY